MISIQGVTKRYGRRHGGPVAVDDLSLEIPAGRIFGLLGPNGAGKTTLLRMTMGLLAPDAGRIRLFEDLAPGSPACIPRIGYMPQNLALYESLTVAENVAFFGRLYGMERDVIGARAREVLERVDLWERRDTRAGELSGGTMRRAMLASAAVHGPELLILDEPTAGVDPLLRLSFWDWFARMADEGTTLLITTHHISEAVRCEEVIFQRAGRVLDRGAPTALMSQYGVDDLEAAFVAATAERERGKAPRADSVGTERQRSTARRAR
jgi:ABC-2 type transport system ATP-binding protein